MANKPFAIQDGIKFPDGSIQTTAYTGQTSSSGELYIMANVDGDIVTSTNGIDWTAPQASGMTGIQRVEIHNGVIVYISGGDMEGSVRGLYYSTELGTVTLCAGTDISTETDNDLFWQQVHYFAGSDKWVAVGYNDGDTNKFPVLAHSDNGITWTVVFVDNTFVTGFNTEDYDWRLTDVAWLDETNQYVITSFLDGPGATGGIFITEDITVALDGTTHVVIDFNARSVVPWSVVGFGGPPGYMILIPSVGGSNNILSGWGTDPEVYDDSFGLWESTFIGELGYAPALTEVAYKNGDFIGVTNDGQVATIDFGIGGPALIISIPLPYTNTVFSISNANPAVITWGMGNVNEANNEKIVVTLAGEYNGTYYVDTGTRVLYTDLAMTTALDASGFAAFTSGTVTFSHGQYFDAAGASNSYYYIGNDDEQVFRSSNGITWTQQADFTGEYFNDFAYGSFGTASANTGNFTFDEDTITNNNGLILSTNRGTLAIGTNMEVPGVAGHFHIGFDGSNINPPSSDLFLGDDYNYVKLPGYELNPADHGVEIGTHDRDGGDSHRWRFETDGGLKFPDDTVQTTAYTGQGGGGASITDSGNVVVTAGSTEHWVATQRRNNEDTTPRGQRYDSQGNLYTLTQSSSNQGNITVITKYTAAGAVSWQRSFTGANATALAVDSNDCAYITLEVGGPEITVVKFSTAGSPLWKKNYEIGVSAFGAFIEEKSATTLALAFSIQDGTPGPNGVVVMEINASTGAVEIKRQITFATPNDTVLVTGIDVDPDENVFVTGFYYDDGDEKNKMFVEKLDENLERVWSKSLETANTYDMYGGDCASDALGNIYVVGSYRVDTMNTDPGITGPQSAGILAKLNSSGVVQWTRRLGPGPCGSFATGLTVTDAGNVYLSAVTFANSTDAALQGYPEYVAQAFGSNKMIVVRYDTQGAVIWQRYVDVANLYEAYDDEQLAGQAVAVYGDKFAVAGYGVSLDNVPFEASSSDDNEFDYFVVQLPTDGTALTIGNLDFTESRVPARFITHTATTSPLDNTVWTTSITLSNSTLVADTETRISNNLVKSETYAYTFGANGTLTIPNDGDLELTQSQVGYLMAIGGSYNDYDNIYSRAVTVDSQGNMYVVGDENDTNESFVMKISSDGVRQWSVRIIEDSEGWNSRANGITIHPTTGNLMVVCEVYADWVYSVLVTLDQDTGRILDTATFSDSNSDVYLNDIAYTSTGTYVLGGSKYGEFTEEFPVTKQTGSDTGVIKILRSAVPGPASTNWQIGGDGFSVFENILNVERYTGLTGTVRQGSGATFTISDNGDGTYGVSAPTLAGTNYRVGHTIKVLGTAIGGATPANDCIVTVNEINPTTGAITILGNVSGTAAGVAYQAYNDLSGANYNVGSGLEFTFQGPRNTTNYDDYNSVSITAGGTNYVANDVVVVLGTSLGGTTPANDLTITVGVSGTAVQYFDSVSGTSQSTTWKLETTTQVDFAGTGSWLITYPLDRQNLLVTAAWQRTFGTGGSDSYDRLYAVTVDTGNNIIAVGEGYGELAAGNFRSLAMAYKFNSTGTIQWAKQLNETNDYCYAKSVVTIGTDIYVTHDSNDNGDTVITKLDSTGAVKWQRITDSGDDSSIARTTDGNILVTAEAYNEDLDQTALKVFLLTPSGETVYQRWLMATTDGNTQFKNGRCLAVAGDSYYISAYFYANSNTSSVAGRLPIDGSGTGEYGSFRYVGVNAMTGSFGPDGLIGINYDINEIDLEDANNYAGALALVTDPYVNEIELLVGSGDFFVDSFYPYLTNETVRDTDGGSIIFPDGTKQNTSATDIPQRRYTGQRYTLGLKDRGHHILCTNTGDSIMIPYWARVNFPIGTVITFVNNSGGNVYINQEGSSINLVLAGDGGVDSVTLANYGIATLLMTSLDGWIISGNVTETTP